MTSLPYYMSPWSLRKGKFSVSILHFAKTLTHFLLTWHYDMILEININFMSDPNLKLIPSAGKCLVYLLGSSVKSVRVIGSAKKMLVIH